MQRHALLMYTSCGWFFDEISRPEGTQILRYAARAMELAEAVSGISLEAEFIGRLEQAPSNVDYFKTGAGVYLKQVQPSQVSLEQVVAHYAMGSLFNSYRDQHQLYCYQPQPSGLLSAAFRRTDPGDWAGRSYFRDDPGKGDFGFCSAAFRRLGLSLRHPRFLSRAAYHKAKSAVLRAFTSNSIAQSVLSITQYFSPTYTLQDLFAEERQQIMQQLNQETLSAARSAL